MNLHTLMADDGTSLSYGLAGPDNGVPVLLCHGLGAAGLQFADDADFLAGHGYRVLVPDLRGHGRSGLPDKIGAAGFSPARLRADLLALLDVSGIDKVHFVGNSLGGILGLGLAREAPGRLASLTIFGTALALDLPSAGWIFPALDHVPGRRVTAWLTARSTTQNRAARPLIATMLGQFDARATAHIVDHIRHYDLASAATGWRGPGLVLVGGRDVAVNRVLPRQLEALRTRPNWQIADLPQGGHCANLDASEDWRAALLSFWQAIPG